MGLPGAGKTTLAEKLRIYFEHYEKKVIWLNADRVRKEYNDWDFSHEGRIRQSHRMRELADKIECDFVICDFVAPLVEMRNNFNAHWTIWVDTIERGRFDNTNRVFVPPDVYDFRVIEQDAEKWATFITNHILKLSMTKLGLK